MDATNVGDQLKNGNDSNVFSTRDEGGEGINSAEYVNVGD